MDISRKRLRQISEAFHWKSADIAEHFGVSQRTVQRYWKDNRMGPPNPESVLTYERLRMLYSKDERNLTIEQIAKMSGWSRSSIAERLRELNLTKL